MSHVVVIDYGMGNLDSARRALEECGGDVVVTDEPSELRRADHIVLPGVGAFPEAMENLRQRGFDEALRDEVSAGAPLLGICLGMQVLAATGSEAGGAKGLGLIDGDVDRLVPTSRTERVPHIGWNEVTAVDDHPLFAGIAPGTDFYFVHGYHFAARSAADVAATTPYAGTFTSAVSHGSVHGVQFHPEKSQRAGFALLRNFLAG